MTQATAALMLVATAVLGLATPTIPSTLDYHPIAPAEAERLLAATTARVHGYLSCRFGVRVGTAVSLGGGWALTNRHVVEGAGELQVFPVSGDPAPATTSVDPALDVAIVEAVLPLETLRLAPRDPRPGDPVTVAGFAGGLELAVAHGRVRDYVDGTATGQAGRVMRLDVVARPGMSGGPVLDAAGRLAGLVYARDFGTSHGLAIPASRLAEALRDGRFGPPGRC